MTNNFVHKKSLGQHFLNSDVVPRWLADAAHLSPKEIVLEIGPGTGALTRELLSRGVIVVALEADQRAIDELEKTFAAEINAQQLHIHHTDVRNLDLDSLPLIADHAYKVVANIPYYLSGFLFRSFLETATQPTDIVFLVQKEVAKRICVSRERKEKESLLSLSVKAYGQPTYIRTVTRGHFTPPPKVDSGIIAIYDVNRNNFKNISEATFFDLLHIGFGQKRKQLLGNLSKRYEREQLVHIFSTLKLPLTVRAEDMSVTTWLTLVNALDTNG